MMSIDFNDTEIMREAMDASDVTRVTFALAEKDIKRLTRLADRYTAGNKSLLIRYLLALADRESRKAE